MKSAKRMYRKCPECGEMFPYSGKKVFCTTEHRVEWNNRMLSRGGALVPYAMAWRQSRNRKGKKEFARYVLNEFCLALDRYSAEDREAGRPPAIEVLESRFRGDGLGMVE